MRRQVAVLLVTAAVLVVDTLLQPLLSWPVDALTQALAVALVPAVHRCRCHPAPALRPRPRRLPGDRRTEPRRVPGRRSTSACSSSLPPCCPVAPPSERSTAAAACGLLLHPLGVRLNRGVDKMFYGDRADPARVLEATAIGLREGLDLAEAPARVCTVVVESLRLGSAALSFGDDPEPHPSRWPVRRPAR